MMWSRFGEGLFQVGDYIVRMLGTDAKPDKIRGDACRHAVFLALLLMC